MKNLRIRNILNMLFNVKSVGNINLNLFGILSYKKIYKFLTYELGSKFA